jgi:hypothetical protein
MDKLKQQLNWLHQWLSHKHAQHKLRKERTVENKPDFIYTEEQLMARLKFFIGICLSLTLFGIVFVVLYSLIFVTQPLNAISPIDQKFFELIVPIATFLTGTLSGIMLAGTKPEDQAAMLAAQKQAESNFEATKKAFATPVSTPPSAPSSSSGFGMAPSVAVAPSAPPAVGFGGKLAPPPAPQPEI